MAATPNEKILVVDDDPDVLDLVVQQVLQPQGYQAATAQDGAAAIAACGVLSTNGALTTIGWGAAQAASGSTAPTTTAAAMHGWRRDDGGVLATASVPIPKFAGA